MGEALDMVVPYYDAPARATRTDSLWRTRGLFDLEKECARAHKRFLQRKFDIELLYRFCELILESQRHHSRLPNGFISCYLRRCRTPAERRKVL